MTGHFGTNRTPDSSGEMSKCLTVLGPNQGCSGAGMRWNAVPANISELERRSSKYRRPHMER